MAPSPPSLPVVSPACGTPAIFTLPLRTTRAGGVLDSATAQFKMRARARGKWDHDALYVECIPSPPACTRNPQGGPSRLVLTTRSDLAGDLDLGWNGISHNFPIVGSSALTFCLYGCDGGTQPSCTASGETGGNTANGTTFGPPLPLLTSNTPVCVVNRFDPAGPDGLSGTLDDNTITAAANVATGEVDAKVHLLMDVFITINTPNNGKGQVCPQCSGDALGDVGTCIGGATPGAQCVVEGTAFVADSTGNTNYKLSSACRPTGSAVATVKLPLDPFRTGTTTGGRCPGQVSDDNCAGGACNAACSGAACDTMTADPTNPEGPQVCRDRKGGISQLCCEDTTTVPCHPTRDGGQIVRTGRAVAPTPDAPGVPFPATGLAVLTSVFCEPGLNNHVLDLTTSGLPGPGALIEPMTAQWLP